VRAAPTTHVIAARPMVTFAPPSDLQTAVELGNRMGQPWTSAHTSAVNDIITITLDLTLGTPEANFYLNGSLMGSAVTLPTGKTWFPVGGLRTGSKIKLIPASLTYPQSGFSDWG
jgi:hypothetical protein